MLGAQMLPHDIAGAFQDGPGPINLAVLAAVHRAVTMPSGIGAPVKMRTASPHSGARSNGWPAATRPPIGRQVS